MAQYQSLIYLLTLFASIKGYLLPSGKEPICPSVNCENNGTLVPETCTCACEKRFTGLLCEQEKQPTKWPLGRYAIPTSAFGCPEPDNFGWYRGFINLTLPETSRYILWNDINAATIEPHILGPFARRVMMMNFCVRRDPVESEWPAGDYCIYRVDDTCPTGFQNGSITIRGYKFSDTDRAGTLPSHDTGNNSHLTLYFCCRDDGDDNITNLFNEFPFVLFKGSADKGCQRFDGAVEKEEHVYMTNELVDWEFSGRHPAVNKTGRHVGLPFCYYVPYARRECIYKDDHGSSYRGRVNVTESGKPCINWKDFPDNNFADTNRYTGEFEFNYCKTIEKDPKRPRCYTDAVKWEWGYCDIPLCADDPDLEYIGQHKPLFTHLFDKGNDPFYAVDGIYGSQVSFLSRRPQMKPFLQVDLQEWYEVHAVLVQRVQLWFPKNLRQAGTYVSKLQWDFLDYGAYRCDDIRYPRFSRNFRFQCKRPIVGQYVTIRNFDSTDPYQNLGKFYYLEINEIKIIGKALSRGRRLGLTSGDVMDYQLYTSSNINRQIVATSARLGSDGAGWCPLTTDLTPWYTVDLVFPTKVEGILIQGWNEGSRPIIIKDFTLLYGIKEDNLTLYEDSAGIVKVFRPDQSMRATSVQRFVFINTIMTRYITIVPGSPQKEACLKLEIIGSPKRAIRDIWCKDYTMDFGFEEMNYHSWWMEEKNTEHILINVTKEYTISKCLNSSTCVSYNYDGFDKDGLLHDGHRYSRIHNNWWVRNVAEFNFAGHRLCFKDVEPIDQCGGDVTLEPGRTTSIVSPGFPFEYQDGLSCKWTVQASLDRFAEVDIIYVAIGQTVMWNDATEGGISSKDVELCSDRLTIMGGGSSPITIKYQDAKDGKFSRTRVISSTSTLELTLESCFHYKRTDERNFELQAKESELPGCGLESGVCHITCNMPAAYIASSRFPAEIDGTETCQWKLEGTFGQYVKLEIINLDILDKDGSCTKSYVSVYDVTINGQTSLLTKVCKSSRIHSAIISSWHYMQIDFRAGNGVGSGFLGRYYLVDFTQTSPDIKSDGCADGWYSYNASCYQMFSEPRNSTVRGITWIRAERECNQHGGHLASISSVDEMAYVHYLMTKVWSGLALGETHMYIGLKKKMGKDGNIEYEWTDGKPLTFTAWFKDPSSLETQPNGLLSERCTVIQLYSIHTLDDWHDVACAYDGITNYICEVPKHTDANSTNRRLKPELMSTESRASVFVCDNGVVISSAFVCDGVPDCGDKSDERTCGETCTVTQFQCDNGKCISMSLYCDFLEHCSDGSDESNCVRPPCKDNQWKCQNKQCIPQTEMCDLKEDCIDGSDELNCGTCVKPNFECYDESCIRKSRVCDGTIDCSGNLFEDEDQMCRNNVQRSCAEWYKLGVHKNNEYKINLGTDDIITVECKFLFDRENPIIQTILHHDQEEPIKVHLQSLALDIKYGISRPQMMALKYENNCQQEFILSCHYTSYHASWIGGYTANRQWHSTVKEGNATNKCDCPFMMNCTTDHPSGCKCFTAPEDWYNAEPNEERVDRSVIHDENHLPIVHLGTDILTGELSYFRFHVGPLVCEQLTPLDTSSFLCRSGVAVPNDVRCVFDYDIFGEITGCRDLSHLDDCASFQQCPEDHVKCPGQYCIPVRLLCDGIKQCKNGEDEAGCDEDCRGMFKCHKSKTCIGQDQVCDGLTHCPEGDDEIICDHATLCPPSCQCTDFIIECYNVTSQNKSLMINPYARKLSFRNSNFNSSVPVLKNFLLAELDMSSCAISMLEPKNFENLMNLYHLDLSMNVLFNLGPSTFLGLDNLKSLNLEQNPSLADLSEFAFRGLSNLPELIIHGTVITVLRKGTFQGLPNIKKLNLSENKLSKVEDETFITLDNLDELDLRGNYISDFSSGMFNGLSNLTKLYTDAYVFCCLKPSTVTEENCLPYIDEFSSCDDLMRNDVLRCFLWIIGLSSLVGNVGVVIFKVFFDKRSRAKGHQVFIANLGLSDLCMGIYLLIIAIADVVFRGTYLWNDIAWRNGVMCSIAGVLATVSSEASVLFLFLITLDRLFSVKFPFGQIQFDAKKARLACLCVWLFSLLVAVIPLMPISYFNNKFYSRSAVCLALPLTRDKPPGWQYGMGLFIILNFVLFMCIAVGQIFIYREVTSTDKLIKSQRRNQETAIARSLFIVVFSDFMCWFPVGVMGIMALSGHLIPSDVYAWTAVFILPINSALNPYLYTFSAILRKSGSSSFRFGSKLGSSGKTNEVAVRRDLKWTEICQSQQFVLGAHVGNTVTLKDYLKTAKPNVPLIYGIAGELVKSVEFLHRRDMIHGCIHEENVLVCAENGVLQSVYSRTVPKSSQESEQGMAKDVEDIGRLVLKMLKWYQGFQRQTGRALSKY